MTEQQADDNAGTKDNPIKIDESRFWPGLTAEQYLTLMRPINNSRIAKRQQGGKQLSYLESYDVKAHLIRIFGFCNFDSEVFDEEFIGTREYDGRNQKDRDENKPPKPMVEVIWKAKVRLTIRDQNGAQLAVYTEGAVGSTSGPANMIGEHHDNALKTAASDAIKRCATFLGSQFGLSLYDNGSTRELVRGTVISPQGVQKTSEQGNTPAKDSEAARAAEERVQHSLGATPVSPTEEGERTNEGAVTEGEGSESEPTQGDQAEKAS